jgi:hypothetical protein
MEQRDHIVEELKAWAPDARWPGKDMPFHVPAGYFEALPGKILEQTALFSLVGTDHPYEVPAGYFERLPEQLLARTRNLSAEEPSSSGKIVSLFFRKIMPYAAAALLGGVLVTGAFIFTDQRRGGSQASTELSNITASHTVLSPENDLYQDISRKMQSLSDDEINRYLEENTSTETLEWQPEELN